MATHRRYGKRHPEAPAKTPPGAQELRDGGVVFGFDRAIAGKWRSDRPGRSSVVFKRMSELERAIWFRAEDEWRPYIYDVAHTAAAISRKIVPRDDDGTVNLTQCAVATAGAIRYLLPSCPLAEAARWAESAVEKPHYIKADQVAARLEITFALHVALGLETIGACDMPRTQRLAQVQADKAKRYRRRNGAVSRQEFVASSFAEQCRQAGVKPATAYKRKKAGRDPFTGDPLPSGGEAYRGDAPINWPHLPTGSAADPNPYRGDAPVYCELPSPPALTPVAPQVDRSITPISVGDIGGHGPVYQEDQNTMPTTMTPQIEQEGAGGGGGAPPPPPPPQHSSSPYCRQSQGFRTCPPRIAPTSRGSWSPSSSRARSTPSKCGQRPMPPPPNSGPSARRRLKWPASGWRRWRWRSRLTPC